MDFNPEIDASPTKKKLGLIGVNLLSFVICLKYTLAPRNAAAHARDRDVAVGRHPHHTKLKSVTVIRGISHKYY